MLRILVILSLLGLWLRCADSKVWVSYWNPILVENGNYFYTLKKESLDPGTDVKLRNWLLQKYDLTGRLIDEQHITNKDYYAESMMIQSVHDTTVMIIRKKPMYYDGFDIYSLIYTSGDDVLEPPYNCLIHLKAEWDMDSAELVG